MNLNLIDFINTTIGLLINQKKIKERLNHLSKKGQDSFKFNAFVDTEITANPERVREVFSNPEWDRSEYSKRIFEFMGLGESQLGLDKEKANVKRRIWKRHIQNSELYDDVVARFNESFDNRIILDKEINLYATILHSMRDAMFYKFLGMAQPLHDAWLKPNLSQQDTFAQLVFANALPLPIKIRRLFSSSTREMLPKLEVALRHIYHNGVFNKDSLMNDLKKAEKDGILTHEEVLADIYQVYIAAHSSSISIMWTMFLLSKFPYYVDKVVNEDGYDKMVFFETLRLLPVFYMTSYERDKPVNENESKCPFHKMMNSMSSKKERVLVYIQHVHRHEEYWKDPNIFVPERFKDGLNNITRGSFIPFGGGGRVCPAAGMVTNIMPRMIKHMYTNYEFTLMKEPIPKRRISLESKDHEFIFKVRKK